MFFGVNCEPDFRIRIRALSSVFFFFFFSVVGWPTRRDLPRRRGTFM